MTLFEKYNQEIHSITQVLRDKYKPKKIILYGSSLNGNLNQDSDIDLIIVKNSSLKRRQRIKEVSDLFLERNIPFDPMVLTEKEFKYERTTNPIMRDILNNSKILYDQTRV